MNEIEAISVLETRIKYPNSDTYDGMCEAEYQQEAVVLAIEALREQEERKKGCEYCLQGEDLAYGHDSMQRTVRIYIDGNLLTADLYSESMAVAVCCCPICGREVEVEHETD